MPWVNLDDLFPEHPKVDALSDGAFRLHVAGICYSNRHRTDGILAVDKINRLVPRYRKSYVVELVDRLLWVELDGGRAYEIHDYLDWNRSRAEIEGHQSALSKVRSAAGKRGAEARWRKPDV